MARKMSRAERKQAFMVKAEAMFEQLESWYDEHPDATFGEIEQAAREERRRFMGHGLEVLINGRDTGKKDSAPQCATCGEAMTFKGYRDKSVRGLEGDSRLERAYYVCSKCGGETFFPPG